MTEPSRAGGLLKNKFFLVGGVVAAGLVIYEYRKQKTASATVASASTAAATSTDPTIDPTTGIPYSDEDYSAALASGSAVGSPYGGAANTVNISPVVGTNPGWVQAATAALVALGFDPSSVASALGAYINSPGTGLTQDQLNIVQAAIGQEGSPPVAVAAPTLTTPAGQTSTATTSVTGSPKDLSQSAYQAGAGSGLWANYQANLGSAANQTAYEQGYNNWVYQNSSGSLGAPTP